MRSAKIVDDIPTSEKSDVTAVVHEVEVLGENDLMQENYFDGMFGKDGKIG